MPLRVRLPGGGEDVFSGQKWVEKRISPHREDIERTPTATRFYFTVEQRDVVVVVKVTVRLESGRWHPDDSGLVAYYRSHAWESVRKD